MLSDLLQVSESKSRYIRHNCDPRYLSLLLQGNQLEESEGRGKEPGGGDGGGVPLAEPHDEDSPAMLVPPLRDTEQPLPPHVLQLGGRAGTHEGVVVSDLEQSPAQ